ncbi:MAG: hypothetical protein ACR2PL_22410 [Dehalococcoidia bacterium]
MVFVLALSRFASALLPVVPTPRQEVGLLWEVEEVRDLIEFVGRIVVELERADRSSDDRYPLGRLRAIEQELKEVEVWCKPELQRGRRRAELDRCLLKVIRLESALMAQLLTRGDPRTTAE